MPKGAKKAGVRNGRTPAQQMAKADFTLYDFAHAKAGEASCKTGRMKKGLVNGWTSEVKKICSQSGEGEEVSAESLAWYEKDLSDFDLSGDEDCEENNNNKEDSSATPETGTPKHSKRKPKRPQSQVSETGSTYPLDLWYLIGDYINPEDVCTFAQLCQSSHMVVHTAGFWYRLYWRFYDNSLELPSHLRPECMERVHGIRPRVITSLFHMYPPFMSRMHALTPMESDPDQLVGTRCVLMWYNKVKALWHFFFKFRRMRSKRCLLAQQRDTCTMQQDLHKADDIDYNPEDNCLVLQVVLQNFISLPPTVMGQVLAKTFVSVGHGMRFHKLKLVFSSEYLDRNDKNALASGTTLMLDPVLNVHVWPWWSPKYPHHRR